jgi:hypothetical protein
LISYNIENINNNNEIVISQSIKNINMMNLFSTLFSGLKNAAPVVAPLLGYMSANKDNKEKRRMLDMMYNKENKNQDFLQNIFEQMSNEKNRGLGEYQGKEKTNRRSI